MDINIIEKDKVLIPEWHGNREKPTSQQIRVLFKHFPGPVDAVNLKKEYYKDGARIIEYNDVSILMNYVDRIENLTFQGKPIREPFDLIASGWTGFKPLVVEIREYVLEEAKELTEGESEASE
jgi:hypothetical protein